MMVKCFKIERREFFYFIFRSLAENVSRGISEELALNGELTWTKENRGEINLPKVRYIEEKNKVGDKN